jgi:hypothetical protein
VRVPFLAWAFPACVRVTQERENVMHSTCERFEETEAARIPKVDGFCKVKRVSLCLSSIRGFESSSLFVLGVHVVCSSSCVRYSIVVVCFFFAMALQPPKPNQSYSVLALYQIAKTAYAQPSVCMMHCELCTVCSVTKVDPCVCIISH